MATIKATYMTWTLKQEVDRSRIDPHGYDIFLCLHPESISFGKIAYSNYR